MNDKSQPLDPGLELFAYSYIGGTWQSNSAWLNMRIGDLSRMVDGVKQASIRTLDGRAPVDELDEQIKHLTDRLQHIRDHAAAVVAVRSEKRAAETK